MEALCREAAGVLAAGGFGNFSLLKVLHRIPKRVNGGFIKKESGLVFDDGFEHAALPVCNDGATRGLRFDGYDAEIFDAGENEGFGLRIELISFLVRYPAEKRNVSSFEF